MEGDKTEESFRGQKWNRKKIKHSKVVGGEEPSLRWFLILEDIHIITSDGNDYYMNILKLCAVGKGCCS